MVGDIYYAGGSVDEADGAAAGVGADRFAPNPFGDGRLYRTGDRGRWTTDGRLEPVTRGEPRLQAALEALDGVAAAATRYWEGRGIPTLAGYLVLEPGTVDTETALHTARSALPEEFADAVLTVVDTIEPATLTRPSARATAPSEPPATPTEETLAAMLVALLGVTDVGAYYPHRVTYHPTCHSLRMLGVGDKPLRLLRNVQGLTLVELPEAESCCGFGGTFAIKNSDTSTAMLADKMAHIAETDAEVCSAGDSSCLMHIGGGLSRLRSGVRTVHLAEILAAT